MPTQRPRHGFSLVELLAVIGILAILIGFLIPVVGKARESGRVVTCTSNVRSIGQAILAYATSNNGQLPRLIHRLDTSDPEFILEYAEPLPAAPSPFNDPGFSGLPKANGFYGALFLLLRSGIITDPKIFICPSTIDVPDDFGGKTASERSNFSVINAGSSTSGLQPTNCSYTYASLYPSKTALSNGYKARLGVLPPGYALLADKSLRRCALFPDTPSNVDSPVGPGNSRNHNKKGQNVLFIDGSVRFEITNRCGLSPTIPDLSKPELPDNIFTAQAGSSCNKVPAQNLTDSVIQEP